MPDDEQKLTAGEADRIKNALLASAAASQNWPSALAEDLILAFRRVDLATRPSIPSDLP